MGKQILTPLSPRSCCPFNQRPDICISSLCLRAFPQEPLDKFGTCEQKMVEVGIQPCDCGSKARRSHQKLRIPQVLPDHGTVLPQLPTHPLCLGRVQPRRWPVGLEAEVCHLSCGFSGGARV